MEGARSAALAIAVLVIRSLWTAGAATIDSARTQTCAIEAAGTVACWGDPEAGTPAVPPPGSTTRRPHRGSVRLLRDRGRRHARRAGARTAAGSRRSPPGSAPSTGAAIGEPRVRDPRRHHRGCWGDNGVGQLRVPPGSPASSSSPRASTTRARARTTAASPAGATASGARTCRSAWTRGGDRRGQLLHLRADDQRRGPLLGSARARRRRGADLILVHGLDRKATYHACAIFLDDTLICWGGGPLQRGRAPRRPQRCRGGRRRPQAHLRTQGRRRHRLLGSQRPPSAGGAARPRARRTDRRGRGAHLHARGRRGALLGRRRAGPGDGAPRPPADHADRGGPASTRARSARMARSAAGAIRGSGATTVPDGLTGVSGLAAGDQFTCAIVTGGAVTCWGADGLRPASPPGGLGGVTQISAGGVHACAIGTADAITCWGGDGSGQRPLPAGLTTALGVAAGATHTCAIKSDRTVDCWGNELENNQAIVPRRRGGDHPVSPRASTTRARWPASTRPPAGASATTARRRSRRASPPGIAEIVTGAAHTCSVSTLGRLTCWGADDDDRRLERHARARCRHGPGRRVRQALQPHDRVDGRPGPGDRRAGRRAPAGPRTRRRDRRGDGDAAAVSDCSSSACEPSTRSARRRRRR